MKVAIIGAGASGCFAAIKLKRECPNVEVTIYESRKKILSKVSLTGGGRCNLTNSFDNVKSLETVYPRGFNLMKRLLKEFSSKDVFRWFEKEGVKLITQEDGCVFPKSQDALEIVNTLKHLISSLDIKVKLSHRVTKIEYIDSFSKGRFRLFFNNENSSTCSDYVLTSIGGASTSGKLEMFRFLKIKTIEPVASLFSFCINDKAISLLMGVVVDNVIVRLKGTKKRSQGALLITDWGMSGPSILKLSSYAARELALLDYKAEIQVNWMGKMSSNELKELILEFKRLYPTKQLSSIYPKELGSRLWLYLLEKSSLNPLERWFSLGTKSIDCLVETLSNDIYKIEAKNKYKEEFVTSGGISLKAINPSTLESRDIKGLFFAGEILDIDGITGGFNLQAAWTTGYQAAKSIVLSISQDSVYLD